MIYETKMIKVCLPGWRCCISSLTINLLVLTIQPLSALAKPNQIIAQVPINESNSKQAANTNTAQTALEPKILSEINRVRTNPQDYARWLEEQRQYYDGIWLRLPGEKAVRTNKGRKALEEAIAFLKEQRPLPPLQTSEQTADTASSELNNFATAKNIQYFSYGRKTATGIVMGLVVDDLFPDRRRRHSLLSPDAENTGVVCKPDPRYAKVCAIAYSDSPATSDIAETKPETTVTPDSDVVADVPEKITTPAIPETITTPETTKPEVATTTPAPENTENRQNTDSATLPVPPQLQAPPTPTESREEQPQQETEAEADPNESESETAQGEADLAEVGAAPEELAEADDSSKSEPEESTTEPEVEAAASEAEEIVENESEEPITDSGAEAEAEIAEIIEDESEQVATNSDSDRLLEKVERGSLEKGDRIIADDGSLYDFYPLQGKAGESFTIYLESDEFDAFVALVDSKGNTVKENDDISEEDSNSRIRVTLPEDGTYNVIVNTYDEQGTGKYVLTVSR